MRNIVLPYKYHKILEMLFKLIKLRVTYSYKYCKMLEMLYKLMDATHTP